jgi:hypothetical protein
MVYAQYRTFILTESDEGNVAERRVSTRFVDVSAYKFGVEITIDR